MTALPEGSKSGPSGEKLRKLFDFCSSDFATIATTAAFVDKTLMIRDVYNLSSRTVITAPRKFGKTTNMDMVKRFFEITVDNASGNPKAVNTTDNYKLFKDNDLEICKDVAFFNEHFGKHPVLHVDFNPLGAITGSVNMIDAFQAIVTASFDEHRYLLKNPSINTNPNSGCVSLRDYYFVCISSGRSLKDMENADSLAKSFNYLRKSLYQHFGQEVIVLIDNYDACFGSMLLRHMTDAEKIISFLRTVICNVFDDKFVERVLITGVLPVIDGLFPSDAYFIQWYQFLDGRPFTKYYGLTCDLDDVINKLITSDQERCVVKRTIDDHYQAYTSRMPGVRVYNTWSVLQYLLKRTVQSHWCQRRHVNHFESCFKIVQLRSYLEDLLVFEEDVQWLDVSQPLSVIDVFKLKNIITNAKIDGFSEAEVELFFILFYYVGYLSVIGDNESEGRVNIRIASEEIRYELARALFNVNGESYKLGCYGLPEVRDICSAINAIRPDDTEVEAKIETFVKKVGWHCFCSKPLEFRNSLFMNFVTSVYGKCIRIVCQRPQWNAGRTVILLKNRYQVVVCITHSESSQDAFNAIAGNDHIFKVFDYVGGKVVIGTDGVNCTYSYCFGQGVGLREPKTIKSRE